MFERSDRYLGIGCILVGALGFLSASKWKVMFSTDPAGPGAIPKILCSGLLILGVILIAGSFATKQASEGAEPFCTKPELTLTLALALCCLIYIVVLPYLGYLLSTPFLAAAVMLLCGVRRPKTLVLVSLTGTLVLFLIFYSLLKVNLPLGFMKDLINGLPIRW